MFWFGQIHARFRFSFIVMISLAQNSAVLRGEQTMILFTAAVFIFSQFFSFEISFLNSSSNSSPANTWYSLRHKHIQNYWYSDSNSVDVKHSASIYSRYGNIFRRKSWSCQSLKSSLRSVHLDMDNLYFRCIDKHLHSVIHQTSSHEKARVHRLLVSLLYSVCKNIHWHSTDLLMVAAVSCKLGSNSSN